MNQIFRRQAKCDKEKDFYKLLNNSIFGYDCSSNIDNSVFERIFDEIDKLRYVEKYNDLFDPKIAQFVNSDLLREEVELDYGKK